MPMDNLSRLIEAALSEDLGPGDVTTDALVARGLCGRGRITAKEPLVLAGLDVARRVFLAVDPELALHSDFVDGDRLDGGEAVLSVEGRLGSMLRAERSALNFLQRLSGIATQTRRFADVLKGTPVRLVDTRKTTPGWRMLEKYAVRMGGGGNHRMGLFDGVLIKDNHIAACGGVAAAVRRARNRISHLLKIEVEVSDLDGVREALAAGADVIMFDNMDPAAVKDAVALIDHRALVEVSGRVGASELAGLAACGVDIISAGALTHSARAVDLSMRIWKV